MNSEKLFVRSTALIGIRELVDELRGDADSLFRKFDLPLYFEEFEFIDCNAYMRLFEFASESLLQPNFGLLLSQTISDEWSASGPGITLLAKAIKVDSFFKAMIQYSKVHTNGIVYEYRDDPNSDELACVFQAHPLIGVSRQSCEYVAACLAKVCQTYFPDSSIKRVEFQHSAPADISFHESTFLCPIVFSAPSNAVVIDRSCLLSEPTIFQRAAEPSMRLYINRLLKRAPRQDVGIEASVMAILPSLLGVGLSDAGSIARHLGISKKKLQRLLAEEGTHYSAVLDKTRQQIASRMLKESDIAISRLAGLLDYSSDKALILAVKRWWNMTPSAYRRYARDNSANSDLSYA